MAKILVAYFSATGKTGAVLNGLKSEGKLKEFAEKYI